MEIQKIHLINFGYRTDRYNAFLGTALLAGVSFEMIERFEPMLDSGSCGSIEKVIELMALDGFPEWRALLDEGIVIEPSVLASFWSKLSCLRKMIKLGSDAIMISDSAHFVGWFPDFWECVSRFRDIEVLNLRYVEHDIISDEFRPCFEEQVGKMQSTFDERVYSNFRGMGSSAMAFSNSGAAKVLDYWKSNPCLDWTYLFFEMGIVDVLNGSYVCIPDVAYVPAHRELKYPFTRTDKNDGSGHYYRDFIDEDAYIGFLNEDGHVPCGL